MQRLEDLRKNESQRLWKKIESESFAIGDRVRIASFLERIAYMAKANPTEAVATLRGVSAVLRKTMQK
jgi:hypothetical protein